jgi:hypothetical protein
MKILYKPFTIVFGLIGARIAAKIVNAIMARFGVDAKPSPHDGTNSVGKVVAAAAVEGAANAATRAAADRAAARSFAHLTGRWPEKPEAVDE